ncbi:hypothetical protein TWF730_006443 [Orbilia blumenaviensis]|uniref:Peptidase S8/S53 domain-containing protein n=1 Tax=Orbilia blumenaviensis TaxID=1796055 RepID=A0AAV9VGN1_9PEZI
MKRIILLTLYLFLSLQLTSGQTTSVQKSAAKDPTPTDEPGDIPPVRPRPSGGRPPPGADDGTVFDSIVEKNVGWGYAPTKLALACIFPASEKRKDAEWLGDLNKRIDEMRYKSSGKQDIGYVSQSRSLGLVFTCFQVVYGNFLEVIRTHGDGISGYIDYSSIYNQKFPKPVDDDRYTPRIRPDKNQKPMRHKRSIISRRQSPVKSLRRRTTEFIGRGVSKIHNLAKRQERDDKGPTPRPTDAKKTIVDPYKSLRRSVEFTQDTAIFSTEPPGMDLEDEYIFDEDDGRDATVYIVDGGLNTNHTAFSWKNEKDPKNMGWIWGGPRPSTRQEEHIAEKPETPVRGSHVASKVIGAVTGLARLASTYMVIPYDADGGINILTYLDALVKMHDQIMITTHANPSKKVVICFSHPVIHVARAQEFIYWSEYRNMTHSTKQFMNTATAALDLILEDFGNMPNVVMVTRATGLLLNEESDPLLSWPARRANVGNLTNLVLVGGVDSNGVKIMQAPDSVIAYAPAQDIRVPVLHPTNLEAYQTIPYSIRLSVGSVSGILAFFMSKYKEDGRSAKNRLEATAYPRIRFGYSVVWNGLRVPPCGYEQFLSMGPPNSAEDMVGGQLDGKKNNKPSEKPAKSPVETPDEGPSEKPDDKLDQKPANNGPDGKPGSQPDDEPNGKPTDDEPKDDKTSGTGTSTAPPKAKRATVVTVAGGGRAGGGSMHYNTGTPIKCAVNPYRAIATTVKTKVNGTATEVHKMKYYYAADDPAYTQKVPPPPKPTIYRPSYAMTITSTTTAEIGKFSTDLENYKDMLRSGKPPMPGAKPGVRLEDFSTKAPIMTTDRYGRTGEVLVVWETVFVSSLPAQTGAVATSATAAESTFVEPTVSAASGQSSSLPASQSSSVSTIGDAKTSASIDSSLSASGTQTASSIVTPAPSQ